MAAMHEEHYCPLESQSNVYGLARFTTPSQENKLLIASVSGKVLCVAFQKNTPCSREVHFTYIPGTRFKAVAIRPELLPDASYVGYPSGTPAGRHVM